MKENGVCVSHYSSSRRDDGDADLSLCERKFSFRVDNVSRVDQDVLYTEELESLSQVTCETCENHVSCISGTPVGQAWKIFFFWGRGRILCLDGFKTLSMVIF